MNARTLRKVYKKFCVKHGLKTTPRKWSHNGRVMFAPKIGRERRTELLSRLNREMKYNLRQQVAKTRAELAAKQARLLEVERQIQINEIQINEIQIKEKQPRPEEE